MSRRILFTWQGTPVRWGGWPRFIKNAWRIPLIIWGLFWVMLWLWARILAILFICMSALNFREVGRLWRDILSDM